MPMVYGPVWTYILAAAIALGGTLLGAVLIIKAFLAAALIATAYLIKRVCDHMQMPESQSWLVVSLFVLNPLVLQTTLVDAHSDILIGLSVVASYYLVEKKLYTYALVCVALGALVKYVTLLLLPVLLIKIIFDRSSGKEVAKIGVTFLALCVVGLLLYQPLGGIMNNLSAMMKEVSERGALEYASFISILLISLLGLSLTATKVLGVFCAFLATKAYLHKPSPFTYVLPFIVLLAVGTPWFQPWYLLWILPLLMVQTPYWLLLVLTLSASFLSPNYVYSVSSWSLQLAVLLFLFYKILPTDFGAEVMGGLRKIRGRV